MTGLSLTEIVAAASTALEQAGYRRSEGLLELENMVSFGRIFEDKFGIVALAAFERWEDLAVHWEEVQGRVVSKIAGRIGRNEPKAWDGYLVLVTADRATPDSAKDERRIQYDASLLRKLVASGRNLSTTHDVQRFLAPLLGIRPDSEREATGSLLERVPELLAEADIQEDVGRQIVRAFVEEESIPSSLHQYLK